MGDGNGQKAAWIALTKAQGILTLIGLLAVVSGSWFVSLYRIGQLEDAVKQGNAATMLWRETLMQKVSNLDNRLVKVETIIEGKAGR